MTVVLRSIALFWAVSACGTEGQLLYRNQLPDAGPLDAGPLDAGPPDPGPLDAGPPDPGPRDASTPPFRTSVRTNMSLQYQITGTIDPQVNAQVFVVDLFDTDSAEVTQLHAAGRIVIGYVSVGTLESWRSDASKFPKAGVGKAHDNYPNEAWLDVRNAEVRDLMRARLQRAVDRKFDGVFASTFGAYRQTSGFPLTRADELDYHTFLTDTAHALGLTIGLSGDFELSDVLANDYDWAIANNCFARDTCGELAPLTARGLPVFDLETGGDRTSICERAKTLGITVSFKEANSSAARSTCP
jgi:hypothetical protein